MAFEYEDLPDDLKARIEKLMDSGLTNADIAAQVREDAEKANFRTIEEIMWVIRLARYHHLGEGNDPREEVER